MGELRVEALFVQADAVEREVELARWRAEKAEKHVSNTYLKVTQALVGMKLVPKAWMELN
jgi:hypothetical protein